MGEYRPECKIVALTAFVNRDNIEKCNKVGMIDVMNKPACSSDIVKMVTKCCPFLPEPSPSPRTKNHK